VIYSWFESCSNAVSDMRKFMGENIKKTNRLT